MKKNKIIVFTVSGIIIFLIIVIIILLNSGKETYISGGKEKRIVSSLACMATSFDEAFFNSQTANTISSEVKVTFKGDKMDKLFYSYTGVYSSDEVAEEDEAVLHAKYNIYLGNNNISHESLSPSYTRANNKLYITLYADSFNKINATTATLFFIDSDKIKEFENYSISELKDYYEKKDFQCQIDSNQTKEENE